MHPRSCHYNILALHRPTMLRSPRLRPHERASDGRAKGAGMSMDDRDVMDGLLAEELEGGMTRGDALKRGAAAGAGLYGLSAVFGAGTALAGMEARALTPTFYQWIYGLYPDIPAKINK